MFSKHYGSNPNSHSPQQQALPPPSLNNPPLFWSCLSSSSAAAELLQLARKSKERAEQMQNLDCQDLLVKSSSTPSPPPPPTSPLPSTDSHQVMSSYKPLLKFSVNAILARDSSPEEDRKPILERSSPSPPQPRSFSPSVVSSGNHNSSSQSLVTSNSSSPVGNHFPYLAASAAAAVAGGGNPPISLPTAPVPRPFLHPPLLPPHLHPLIYQQSFPRSSFTLPGTGTTLFHLPGSFPWSAGFRGM